MCRCSVGGLLVEGRLLLEAPLSVDPGGGGRVLMWCGVRCSSAAARLTVDGQGDSERMLIVDGAAMRVSAAEGKAELQCVVALVGGAQLGSSSTWLVVEAKVGYSATASDAAMGRSMSADSGVGCKCCVVLGMVSSEMVWLLRVAGAGLQGVSNRTSCSGALEAE